MSLTALATGYGLEGLRRDLDVVFLVTVYSEIKSANDWDVDREPSR